MKGAGEVPAATTGAGGLEVIEGGVSVFGQPVKVEEPPADPAPQPKPEPAKGEEAGVRLRTLIEELKDPDEYARARAITEMEQLGDPAAIEPLISVIDDRRAPCPAATTGLARPRCGRWRSSPPQGAGAELREAGVGGVVARAPG